MPPSWASASLLVVIRRGPLAAGSIRRDWRPLWATSLTTASGAKSRIEGRVTAIAPIADAKTRTFSVEVTIANAQNVLRPGMVAALALSTGPNDRTAVPVVPLSAIVRSPDTPGGFGVFVVEERSGQFVAHARAVDLGDTYGNLIGIHKGVAAGERVIVSGADFVRNAQQVRVLQ